VLLVEMTLLVTWVYIRGLQHWGGLGPAELAEVLHLLRKENLALETGPEGSVRCVE
jgi:hypothetical protein